MHLQITKDKYKGKITRYAKIVESYRVPSKGTRKKLILNLGPVRNDGDMKRFNKILQSMKTGNEFASLKELKLKDSKEFGVTYTTTALFDKYEIKDILQKNMRNSRVQFDVYGIIKALIINRLIEPLSDHSAYDWICNDYSEDLLIKEHHVYRALDHLIKKKEEIEKDIFESLKKKLKLNTDRIYYDLTSTYFEGSQCIIALYGHSRDHRRDRKQIVIGLVMCDGIPIYHEVFEGNTVDKSTLKEMVENLKKVLGIKRVIFVADRGIITDGNLGALEDEGYQYILGVSRRNNNLSEKLLIKKISSKKEQFAKEVHRIKFERNKKKYMRRYILCINKETRKERLDTLKTIKRKINKKLKELQEKYASSQKPSHKGKKMTRDSLMNKAYKILGKNKRIFRVWFNNGLRFSLNKDKCKYEKKIAGRFLLVTSTDINSNETMKAYKELQIVENAFDKIKNFLDIRPIGHHKENRVKAHVFICILSFLVESLIQKLSSESARQILRKLKRIHVANLETKTQKKKLLTDLSKESEELFKKLGIPKPI